MRRRTVDPTTNELLRSLSETVELCDEAGHVLGKFVPEPAELVAAEATPAQTHAWQGHENLGIELDVFGYEHDID